MPYFLKGVLLAILCLVPVKGLFGERGVKLALNLVTYAMLAMLAAALLVTVMKH